MSEPHGGASQIWRDGTAGAHNPRKLEIRDWGTDKEARIADLEAIGAAGYTATPGGPVACATTGPVTASGEQTIDGVLTSNSRVLRKDEASAENNGVFVTSAGAWSRAADMDAAGEFFRKSVYVVGGEANGGRTYGCASTVSTVGTDAVSFTLLTDQSGLADDVALKAPLASPELSGTPTAPTAAAGTDSTQIATTAFVQTTTERFPKGTYIHQAQAQEVPEGWIDLGAVSSLYSGTAMRLITNYHQFWSVQNFARDADVFQDATLTTAIGGSANNQRGICWGKDGTRLYALSRGDSVIRQMNLTTPYDISGGFSYSSVSPGTPASGTSHGVWFRDDGLMVYVYHRTVVRSYALTTAWEISTLVDTIVAVVDCTAPGVSRGHGMTLSPDGVYIYVDCRQDTEVDDPPAIYQWEMSTPWDLSTMSFVGRYQIPLHLHSAQRSHNISPDGKRLFINNVGTTTIWEYELTTPWMVTTARPKIPLNLNDLSGSTTEPYSFAIRPDGTKLVFSEVGGAFTQVSISPVEGDYSGSHTLSAIWEYDTTLDDGLTVTIDLRAPRVANYHVIDWGDGTEDTLVPGAGTSELYSHTYATDGTYQVTLTGGAGGLVMAYDAATRNMLTRILDFGTGMGWLDFSDIAKLCPNLSELPNDWPASVRISGSETSGSNGGAFLDSPNVGAAVPATWDLRSLTKCVAMFEGVGTLSADVSWALPNARNMRNFLSTTTFNQRLDDLGSATDIRSMLSGTGFDNDSPKNWDWRTVINAAAVFPTLSTANYDAILIAIAAFGDELQSGVAFGASSSTYSPAAAAARTYLTGTKSWVITDGGPE